MILSSAKYWNYRGKWQMKKQNQSNSEPIAEAGLGKIVLDMAKPLFKNQGQA